MRGARTYKILFLTNAELKLKRLSTVRSRFFPIHNAYSSFYVTISNTTLEADSCR
jgi:hypothetical protein